MNGSKLKRISIIKNLERAVHSLVSISIETTGKSWGEFFQITFCGTGVRFGNDASQTCTVSLKLRHRCQEHFVKRASKLYIHFL